MKKNSINNISQSWASELTRQGYRITQPRRVILEIIAGSYRPLTPLEIYDLARKINPGIGLVTVYRTVEKLEELKLVDRVHLLGDCQTVFRSTKEHQHLLVCTRCGSSQYFDGLKAEEQFRQIGETLGYRITGHWLQLAGICEECQNNERKSR
jgi:Fur family ferric uptake transcriptional regulator